MLTEILIKPYLDDLKSQGIEDTTPYEQGFLAGMTALSDILSENIDNQPQFFTYLGMAISEGHQWIESLGKGEDDIPVFAETPKEPRERQPTPSSDFEPERKVEAEFDFIPSFDTPADFVRKYKNQTVFYKQMQDLSIERIGNMVLDLSQNELILIDSMTSNQVKKPYYVRLK
jgi:hypothetical protein